METPSTRRIQRVLAQFDEYRLTEEDLLGDAPMPDQPLGVKGAKR